MEPFLVIVDASSFIFRAFYAVRQRLTAADNTPTNAVYGFKNMISTLMKDLKPSHVAMVFDDSGKSFRNDIYPEYKANRDAAPDDLVPQFALIHELVETLNLNMVKIPGVEADDVIATLVKKYSNLMRTLILSGDKDLTQLVSDRVHMLDTMKNFEYDPQAVEAKFGVPPERIAEYLAIVGDSSDNIPGAAGIGPVGAKKLFDQFGTLEEILKASETQETKELKKIRASRENVELSLRLTVVNSEVELGLDLDTLVLKDFEQTKAQELYRRLNFKQDRLVRLSADSKSESPDLSAKNLFGEHAAMDSVNQSSLDRSVYRTINDKVELTSIINSAIKDGLLVFDFETTSLDFTEAKIVGIALAGKSFTPVYVPCAHENVNTPQIPAKEALDVLCPFFSNPAVTLVCHNLKYEWQILGEYGIYPQCKLADTILMSYILHADTHRHGLGQLAEKLLGHKMISFDEVTGKGKNRIGFSQVALDVATNYAAEDADATYKLYDLLKPKIEERNQVDLYENLELALCVILAEIEKFGIKIDVEYMRKMSAEMKLESEEIAGKIYEMAGEEFNINSPKQLGEILFRKLNLDDNVKKTKTGISTDASVLEKLALSHPIAAEILKYRSLQKLMGTYLDVLPTLVRPKTGRLHTSFNQTVAATGRLSSSDPNLQNIPIKGRDGIRIRGGFIAAEGCSILSADYSQIELRVLAHLSGDEGLISAFEAEQDIHSSTAAGIFGLELEKVTSDQRRMAKAINFGIIYGMGAFRLAQETGISQTEAKNFIDMYFARYSSIRRYMKTTIDFAKTNGYVETLFGRRRYIPGIYDRNHVVRTASERIAVNTTVQGTAADIIKKAMIDIFAAMKGKKSRMLLQVHDELVFEVHHSEKEEIRDLVTRLMRDTVSLKVPLKAETGIGPSWRDAHD